MLKYMVAFSVSVNESVRDDLDELAESKGIPRSLLVRKIMEHYLANKKDLKAALSF